MILIITSINNIKNPDIIKMIRSQDLHTSHSLSVKLAHRRYSLQNYSPMIHQDKIGANYH